MATPPRDLFGNELFLNSIQAGRDMHGDADCNNGDQNRSNQ